MLSKKRQALMGGGRPRSLRLERPEHPCQQGALPPPTRALSGHRMLRLAHRWFKLKEESTRDGGGIYRLVSTANCQPLSTAAMPIADAGCARCCPDIPTGKPHPLFMRKPQRCMRL